MSENEGNVDTGKKPDPMFTSALAPDVGVGGAHAIRSTVTFVGHKEDSADDEIQWRLTATPATPDDPSVFVVGDLRASANGWFVGVTVACGLHYRDKRPPYALDDSAQCAEHAEGLAYWATNLLYDQAAGLAKSLVAVNIGASKVEIPIITPRPTVRISRTRASSIIGSDLED